jgi:hypothetical protein
MAVGGVDRLVDVALEALGSEDTRLLVTGGWGRAWLAASRHAPVAVSRPGFPAGEPPGGSVLWDEALVHRGISRWAEGLG